jgi:hypothetical protein
MGNYNSGRRPEIWNPRAQVEDALILDIALLRAHDALSAGSQGVIQWPDAKSRASFCRQGETLTLDYSIRGQAYRQHVQLTTMVLSLNHAPHRTCLLCSECGRRGYKLYLSKLKPFFLCRKCQNLCYEQQTYNSRGLCYMLYQGIRRERKYVMKLARKH